MTKLDTLLYWYTLTLSAALIFSAVNSGFTLQNLTTIALFLPVPAFTLLQGLKRYYLWKQSALAPESLSTKHQSLSTFSLKPFLTQQNPVFIISLVLLVTAWLISFIRSL